uniref:Uncharacterized protein n=1 Tax=Arundo donax TaxID=35708 RepID=A0A0A9F7A0_ARUDO
MAMGLQKRGDVVVEKGDTVLSLPIPIDPPLATEQME